MAAVEVKAPGEVRLIRICNPLLEEKIQATIAEIQEKARQICQITLGSGTKYEIPSVEIDKAAGAFSSGDLATIQTSSAIIATKLKKFCELLPEDEKGPICEVVEKIKHESEFPEKLLNIAVALSCLHPVLQEQLSHSVDIVILTVLPEEYSAICSQISDV